VQRSFSIERLSVLARETKNTGLYRFRCRIPSSSSSFEERSVVRWFPDRRNRASLYRIILITRCQTAATANTRQNDRSLPRAVPWSTLPPRRGFTGPSLRPREKAKIHFDRDAARRSTLPRRASPRRRNDRRWGKRRGAVEEPSAFIYRFTIT